MSLPRRRRKLSAAKAELLNAAVYLRVDTDQPDATMEVHNRGLPAAMNLSNILSAQKSGFKIGAWQTGKVPKTEFPIAKNALRLGSSFSWCVIKFEALGAECRVLVTFDLGKQKFDAIFGVMSGGALRILCSYQYHSTEPGWHVHATCDPVSAVPAGFFRGPWVQRIPRANQEHRRKDFALNDRSAALRFALDHYRLEERGPLL